MRRAAPLSVHAVTVHAFAGCAALLPSKMLSKAKGDRFCQEAAKQHFNLTEMSLSGCDAVTDKGVIALLSSWVKLSKINLEECKYVTDKVLSTLVESCPAVTHINLDGCTKVMIGFRVHSCCPDAFRVCYKYSSLKFRFT